MSMLMTDESELAGSLTTKKGSVYCDLDVDGWAVVSHRGVEVTNVNFRQACRAVIRLKGVSGATVCTADAAGRWKSEPAAPPETAGLAKG